MMVKIDIVSVYAGQSIRNSSSINNNNINNNNNRENILMK